MHQSACILLASAMLLTTWMCCIEGAIHPQIAKGRIVAGHMHESSHEGDPNNAPVQHSHGPSHSDESIELCCTQVLAMRKSAFRLLVVDGPVAWQLVEITGDSPDNRGVSLEGRNDLARVPVGVHEANSYYFALPIHAPPLFS